MNDPSENETPRIEFDPRSVEIGMLVQEGGEPLQTWFSEFMSWVISSIEEVAQTRGLDAGRKLYQETSEKIVEFLNRVPFVDKDSLTRMYEEKMRGVNLRYGMKAITQMPTRGGQSRSLFLDIRRPYVDQTQAVEIGGGQIARIAGAE